MNKRILVGSNYFFKDCEGYKTTDMDYIVMVEKLPVSLLSTKRASGEDIAFVKRRAPERFVYEALNTKTPPILYGKFLVPEFNAEIGFTIDHLKQMEPVFDKMDEKHKYLKSIFNSYIENGEFVLTDEQRRAAYEEYKKEREIKQD